MIGQRIVEFLQREDAHETWVYERRIILPVEFLCLLAGVWAAPTRDAMWLLLVSLPLALWTAELARADRSGAARKAERAAACGIPSVTLTCDSATGMCSNPAKADGATCDDGDACTQMDTCTAGACGGADPVTCTAADECHEAGMCDSATGMCSNPAKADGSSCNDNDACTQTDTCQAGACAGAMPVMCSASDQCHDVGTCESAMVSVAKNKQLLNATAPIVALAASVAGAGGAGITRAAIVGFVVSIIRWGMVEAYGVWRAWYRTHEIGAA